MNKLLRALPGVLIASMIGATIVFLSLFLRGAWQTIAATETLAQLRSEVATVALDRARFNRVVTQLKEKIATPAIDWKKLRDPF